MANKISLNSYLDHHLCLIIQIWLHNNASWQKGHLIVHLAFSEHRIMARPIRISEDRCWASTREPSSFHTKIFRVERTRLKTLEKLPIPCKFCTYRFIRYSSTCYGKVRINPLMANTRNPGFFASPVANAAWFVVVRPCYLNRDLLSGPKGN